MSNYYHTHTHTTNAKLACHRDVNEKTMQIKLLAHRHFTSPFFAGHAELQPFHFLQPTDIQHSSRRQTATNHMRKWAKTSGTDVRALALPTVSD